MGLNDPHEFTDADITLIARLVMGFTIPGTCLCFLVLVAYAYVARSPKSRSQLDRVSFRLLTYAIISNVLWGISFVMDTSLHGPSAGCSFVAFLSNITLIFSACCLFCISLNLQLVLVHGKNGNAMEKYYVIGTIVLSCALNVPIYALNQFGWNVANSTCWFSTADDGLRFRYIIGTQSFWTLLIAVGETINFFVVLSFIIRYDRTTKHMLESLQAGQSSVPAATISTVSDPASQTTAGYSSKYRKIIMRIGLYPLVSCILNISTVALDLYQTIDGVTTEIQFQLSILDLCLYGIRTLCYAVLAATDPSFIRAIRLMRGRPATTTLAAGTKISTFRFAETDSHYTSTGGTQTTTEGQRTVHIELQNVSQSDNDTEAARADDASLGLRKEPYDEVYPDGKRNPSVIDLSEGVQANTGTGFLAARAEASGSMRVDPEREEALDREFTRQI